MQIRFSEPIEPIEFNNTRLDLIKLINPENLNIYADPAVGRDEDNDFDPSLLSLTW